MQNPTIKVKDVKSFMKSKLVCYATCRKTLFFIALHDEPNVDRYFVETPDGRKGFKIADDAVHYFNENIHGTGIMQEIKETHQTGIITVEQNLQMQGKICDFGIQVAKDGRVWICVDGEALLRFRPCSSKIVETMKEK